MAGRMDKTKEDTRIGAVLGNRYRITELLGEGGMGMVYRGERMQLGKPVAIKFLHTPYSRSAKFVARFEREARAMSKLSHPHLVSVIDFGVQEAPYIVMDFVTGSTVRDVLDAGPVPVARSLSITRQVLFGLASAHSEGVIHRDIKPGNIMLAELAGIGDHVRIFDFGLAKLHDSESEGDMSTAAIVGTPAYMAPEQARAEKIDARVDIYATGVVLFELLTGQKPFQGDDAYTVLCMQRDKPPPKLRELAPQLSPELEAVVAQALEKDVDKRHQNAADFITALDGVPEATGRPSSERDLAASGAIAFAKTQHQLQAPHVGSPVEDSTEGSLAGMPIAEPRPRRSSARMWMMLVFIAASASAFVILRVAPRSLTEQMAMFGREESAPVESTTPSASPPAEPPAAAAAAEPPAIAPEEPPAEPAPDPGAAAPVEPPAPSELAPAAAAEPAVAAESEVAAEDESEGEGEGSEELSAAALAAADEALNETSESEAKIVEPPPSNAVSLATVYALIRQNKTGQAMGVIQVLRRKSPKSAELPYLLGDLYFDRHWWSDGLAKYREAIKLGPGYRKKASIQRNAIVALADDRTYPRARALLVKDIGRAATQRLKKAAKNDSSRTVRKRAHSVLAALY
jgi:eukaryotic-like serine/threonine-protein kinase